MCRNFIHSTALLLAALVASTPFANAQDYGSVAKLEFLSGWNTKAGTQMAGIAVTLEPGWKTYWRKPGDAGIPPVFDWDGSSNLQSVTLHWPTPSVFQQDEYHSVGYSELLILPIELRPESEAAPIMAHGTLQLGVCREVCVPISLDFDQSRAIAGSTLIQQALDSRPLSRQRAGVGKVTCAIKPISDGLQMTISAKAPALGGREHLIVELPDPTIWISQADTKREGSRLIATVDMVPENAAPFSLNRSDVRVTLLGNELAVDIQGCSGD